MKPRDTPLPVTILVIIFMFIMYAGNRYKIDKLEARLNEIERPKTLLLPFPEGAYPTVTE